MTYSSITLSEDVARILAEHSDTILPLIRSRTGNAAEATNLLRVPATTLFPGARRPEAALSGLLLLLGCWKESHEVAQDDNSVEGSYWHAIVHRMEPDSANAGYWFRRVGCPAVFEPLHRKAAELMAENSVSGWTLKSEWDPFLFVDWCDEACQSPGSAKEALALAIHRAEWDLLFDWCASPVA